MEFVKGFFIALFVIAQKSDAESLSKLNISNFSKNVILVYSNSNNHLRNKVGKMIDASFVMPDKESKIFLVYPESTTISTTDISESDTVSSVTVNSNLIGDITTEDYTTIQLETFTNLNTFTTNHSNELTTHFTSEENTALNFNDETSTSTTPATLIESPIDTTQIFESTTTEATTAQTLSSEISIIGQKELIENEIEIQSSEKHITTLVSTTNKVKKNIFRNLERSNVVTPHSARPAKILQALPSNSSNISLKKHQKLSNMTKSINDVIMFKNSILTNKRDSLLRQSIKSKKFISALIKRNKNRLSATISNSTFQEISTTPIQSKEIKVVDNSITRRIYMPIRLTTTTATSKKISKTFTSPTISTVKEFVTLFPDEISDKDFSTEWRAMKINKKMNATYRGRKRFSITDIVPVYPKV